MEGGIAGIGEYVIGHEKDVLSAIGLGSCIGVVLFDPIAKVAGLLHVMLPDSHEYIGNIDENKLSRYADKGILRLIDELIKLGANKLRIKAKIAGGAHMFETCTNYSLQVGKRNIEAVEAMLKGQKIELLSEDVGGSKGRSIHFDLTSEKLHIRTVLEEKEI